ncbi:MAG: AMP-binding protein [Actinobacteria bacterium]|nr:AMP-binding protein [Actinomycetota bacterium]
MPLHRLRVDRRLRARRGVALVSDVVASARSYAIGDIVRRSALRVPERTALVFGDVRYSYAELDAAVNRVANALTGRGVARGDRVAILSLGTRLGEALRAADELAARGLPATVADARFAKPLDTALIERLAREHAVLITIEEGSLGGFGSAVLQHLAWKGLLDGGLKVRPMVLPDMFIDHDSPAKQMIQAGLTARDIVDAAIAALGKDAGAVRA